jgi:hypothetical protein
MKKVLLCIILVLAFTCGSAAFAHGYDSMQVSFQREHDPHPGGKNDKMRGLGYTLKEKTAAVRQNQIEINRLRLVLSKEIQQSKMIIGDLRKDTSSLNAAKISTIRQILERINQAQQVLSSTEGTIQRKNVDLKFAKNFKSTDTLSQVMNGVIYIQETRINALNELISAFDILNEQLK